MRLGDGDGRALNLIERVDRRGRGGDVGHDEREVFFGAVFADAAMHAARLEAFGRADVAAYLFDFIWVAVVIDSNLGFRLFPS